MFGTRFKLFRLFGFTVSVDASWFIVAVLLTWTLAQQFAADYEIGPTTYWLMGLAGMLGLFASIVVHEFAHSLVARRRGVPIRGITLFIFGGVAEMEREPPNAKTEFLVAIAGPIASVLIAGACYGLYWLGVRTNWPAPVNGVLQWLAIINLIVVGFNLVPAFPLDGGRVLRSILWHYKQNLRWATRVTSTLGSIFGMLLIGFGIFSFMAGNFIGGIWMGFIGLFLLSAARMSYQQLILRRELEGEPVSHVMRTDVRTVPPDITIQQCVEDYLYRYDYKMFPVARNGDLVGCVTTRRIKEVPRDQWDRTTVGEIVNGCTGENTISPDADAMQALSKMQRNQLSRLMVVDHGQLQGVFSLKDVMNLMARKVELGED